MSRRRERTFASPREVVETYFPDYSRQKKSVQADRYSPPHPDSSGKLAEEFAASLRKKTDRE